METLSNHFGEILTAISLLGGAIAFGVGTYIAVRTDLVKQYEKHKSLVEKVDDHIGNRDVHLHRRDDDPTGYYHTYIEKVK